MLRWAGFSPWALSLTPVIYWVTIFSPGRLLSLTTTWQVNIQQVQHFPVLLFNDDVAPVKFPSVIKQSKAQLKNFGNHTRKMYVQLVSYQQCVQNVATGEWGWSWNGKVNHTQSKVEACGGRMSQYWRKAIWVSMRKMWKIWSLVKAKMVLFLTSAVCQPHKGSITRYTHTKVKHSSQAVQHDRNVLDKLLLKLREI